MPHPFDTIAPDYDKTFTDTPVGRYQRRVVTGILSRRFQPGMHILEVGCGTGADTVFLAGRGVRVTATDASSAMIDMTRQRVEAAGVQGLVDCLACPAEQLPDQSFEAPFDGLLSNFGALNCLPDLTPLNGLLSRHLRPGGYAVLCFLGRWCLWEMAFHMMRFDGQTAFRRMAPDGAMVPVGDEMMRIQYPSPRQIAAVCRPVGRHIRTTGVGLLIPPSYMNPFVERHLRLFRMMSRLDRIAARIFPLNRLGDHYCLEVERR